MAARSRALRNVLAAVYPDENVRWRSIFAAYAAGVGVNTPPRWRRAVVPEQIEQAETS